MNGRLDRATALAFAGIVVVGGMNGVGALGLLGGGGVMLADVYLGAFAPSLSKPLPGLFRRRPAAAPADRPEPPTLINPSCP